MAYRMQRMASVIREVVSDCVANRLSDPRLARFISVTRVEMTPDLAIANVYLSVMGTDAEGATSMRGMASARGMIQSRIARALDVRQCPEIRFHLDKGLKIAAETIRRLGEQERAAVGEDDAADDGPTGDSEE